MLRLRAPAKQGEASSSAKIKEAKMTEETSGGEVVDASPQLGSRRSALKDEAIRRTKAIQVEHLLGAMDEGKFSRPARVHNDDLLHSYVTIPFSFDEPAQQNALMEIKASMDKAGVIQMTLFLDEGGALIDFAAQDMTHELLRKELLRVQAELKTPPRKIIRGVEQNREVAKQVMRDLLFAEGRLGWALDEAGAHYERILDIKKMPTLAKILPRVPDKVSSVFVELGLDEGACAVGEGGRTAFKVSIDKAAFEEHVAPKLGERTAGELASNVASLVVERGNRGRRG
jgi:hypothetical protein